MHSTYNDIAGPARKKLIALMQPLLSDAIDLHYQAKQAHWNVRGASFIALHELFDKVAGEVEEHVDTIAERIAQLGGMPEGTIRSSAKRTRLKEYPLSISEGEQHVEALCSAISTFNAGARDAIDTSDEIGDKVTADMFTGIARGLDKTLWFIESHLQRMEKEGASASKRLVK